MNNDTHSKSDLNKTDETNEMQTSSSSVAESNLSLNPATPDNPLTMTPAVDFTEIELLEKVGHGSYGTVYKAEWQNRLVAVKEFAAGADQKSIKTEVKQLSRVTHPNIIALFGISVQQQSTYLIMEYAEGGSLHTFLHGSVKPRYTTAHAMSWARQCAEGVAYLHAMKPKPMIHRDLKPLNLLLTDRGRRIKICDFGTVVDKQTLMTNNKGSAAWMAPEVFEGSKYTEKCDIFSWGIILWEVLSREQPFKEIDNTYSIMWKIHNGDRPPLIDCPERIKKLMTSCWAKEPEKRPSMQYVVGVMTELTDSFPGAEEPLEYIFENQQISLTGSSNPSEENYTLDFSNCTSSSLDSMSALTPTNSSERAGNLFPPLREVPVASIMLTSRWDAINGDSDSNDHTPTSETNTIFNSAGRYLRHNDTIRDSLARLPANATAPLSVDVDPNAWELNSNDDFAKSDGKDCLTVTETKPLLSHSTTTINHNSTNFELGTQASLESSSTQNEYFSNFEGEDENDYETDKSLVDTLEPDLRPESPIPENAESQAIYQEHISLAKKYLADIEEICYTEAAKKHILAEMKPEERRQKEAFLKKLTEKDELLELLKSLNNQYNPTNMAEDNSQDRSGTNTSNDLLNDGWVVIPNHSPSNQNSGAT